MVHGTVSSGRRRDGVDGGNSWSIPCQNVPLAYIRPFAMLAPRSKASVVSRPRKTRGGGEESPGSGT